MLNRAAFALGQLVAGGHLSDDQVRSALLDAGVCSGLEPPRGRRDRCQRYAGRKAITSPPTGTWAAVHLEVAERPDSWTEGRSARWTQRPPPLQATTP